MNVPDGWVEREPELREDRLFVSTEAYEDGIRSGTAKRHVAIYGDGIVECYDTGDYHFHEFADPDDRVAKAKEWMEAHNGGG